MPRILLAFLLFASSAFAQRPDIVLVMADDMGYSDIGCYGGEIRTPNLDRLATRGLRLTRFHNNARCCPTRASLMTGLWPHQTGIGLMMSDRGHPGYRGDLNDRCVTIAQVLKDAGYRTAMSGKWHLTKHLWPDGDTSNWPCQRGFDEFFGTITGAGSFYDPFTLTRQNASILPGKDFYYTDAISDEACAMVRKHADETPDQPLFLYVAHTAPHWPLHAKAEDIARYRGRYSGGWDRLRKERFARMKGMGLVDWRWRLSPRDGGIPDWDSVPDKEWFERRMEVYAAQVDCMDQGIGRLVTTLAETGRLENTLFLFLADNGGCAEEMNSGRRRRPSPFEDVSREPKAPAELERRMQPTHTRDGRPVRLGRGVMPGPDDTYLSYGKPWANASNTPFRFYKHYGHEGGTASPLIVHWPAGMKRRGELDGTPAHVIDVMATCVDVASASYPKDVNGAAIRPLEGTSLRPVLEGKTLAERTLFWEHHGNRAVQRGRWKLSALGENGPWELYDLEVDRTETNDLAAAQPERVAALAAEWREWAERCNVLPMNPGRNRNEKLSKKRRFRLGPGAKLPRAKAPDVRGKGLVVRARLETVGEGVVVAQGGSAHGWVLYVKDGHPTFATRRGGELREHRAKEPLCAEAVTLVVELATSGEVRMTVGDVTLLEGKESGPLRTMPGDGLEVGQDLKGAVGDYETPYRYTGDLIGVTVILRP